MLRDIVAVSPLERGNRVRQDEIEPGEHDTARGIDYEQRREPAMPAKE